MTSRGPDCRVVTRCAGAAQRRIAMLHSNYSPETTRCGKGTKIANRIKFYRVTMDNCTSLTLPASFLFNLESYSSCSSLHVIPALAQLYLLVPLVRLLWVSFFWFEPSSSHAVPCCGLSSLASIPLLSTQFVGFILASIHSSTMCSRPRPVQTNNLL